MKLSNALLSGLEVLSFALKIFPPNLWKVEISMPSGNFSSRSRTEGFENDKHNMSVGLIPFFSIKYLTLALTVKVLPQPAPAIIWVFNSFLTTANLCLSSRDLPSILSKKSLCSINSFST